MERCASRNGVKSGSECQGNALQQHPSAILKISRTGKNNSAYVYGLSHFHSNLLVELLEAGLAHSHLFLNAELGDSGVFGRAFAAEDLSTRPAVVLMDEKHHGSGNTNTSPILLIRLLSVALSYY